jgi:hypothetical protein
MLIHRFLGRVCREEKKKKRELSKTQECLDLIVTKKFFRENLQNPSVGATDAVDAATDLPR